MTRNQAAIQVAIYARVSSERQRETHTIASQLADLRKRVIKDGFHLVNNMEFVDDGYSGATMARPALERLRDVATVGTVDKLYVHSPDRLARKYAYQVLLVDELSRVGVEVVFLNREIGRSPEDDLLLQVQGMMAEYERAKIVERHRRGKLHAAHSGSVNVLSGAPYGYRYITKYEGGGQARYDVAPEQAQVVRDVFKWVGGDRLTIGEVCRQLNQRGAQTSKGKTTWDRSVVWGMLKNPAYVGTACFGKTCEGPLRPRLRSQRGRPQQPKHPTSTYDVETSKWIHIQVPAIVEPELFAAVQEQLEENRRHQRQSQRGALYLLQGLVECKSCGYAYYGKKVSPSATHGKKRRYAYYRCLGTDAYRFGGKRLCWNKQVRTDLLDSAVWGEVCTLLADPERVAAEYRRRLQPESRTHHRSGNTIESQLAKLQQAVERLIDSYTEQVITKEEFVPRLTRLRQRITHLKAQKERLRDEAQLQQDLRLIIGQLEDFAKKIDKGLAELDWTEKREVIRGLVKRVEIASEEVNVVFHVNPTAGPGSAWESLPVCRGRNYATLW
jgi:site-specific DNA recombinase